jgi:serine/threonine protein kinase
MLLRCKMATKTAHLRPRPREKKELSNLEAQLKDLKSQVREERRNKGLDQTQFLGYPVYDWEELYDDPRPELVAQGKQASIHRVKTNDGDVLVKKFFYVVGNEKAGEYDTSSRDGSLDDKVTNGERELQRIGEIRKMLEREEQVPPELYENKIVPKVLGVEVIRNREERTLQPSFRMQLEQGETLEQLYRRKGRLSEGEVLDILEAGMNSLGQIHDAEILHRDIKEDNIFMLENGNVMYLDMSMSRPEQMGVLSGTIGGTSYYTPSEQWEGNACRSSDIYAWGQTVKKIMGGVIRSTPLKNIVDDMTKEHVKARLQNTDEVLRRINSYRAELNGEATKTLEKLSLAEITNWDVPSVEATALARSVVGNDNLSRLAKTTRLQEYLETEPVRDRDTKIIEYAIGAIGDGEPTSEIVDSLQESYRQNPELIFSFTRRELGWLYDTVVRQRNYIGVSNQHIDISSELNEPVFRQFIETIYEENISFDDATTLIRATQANSHMGNIEVDKTAYKQNLKEIKKGKREEDIAIIKEKYQRELSEEDSSDPRVQAMLLTLDAQEDVKFTAGYHHDEDHYYIRGAVWDFGDQKADLLQAPLASGGMMAGLPGGGYLLGEAARALSTALEISHGPDLILIIPALLTGAALGTCLGAYGGAKMADHIVRQTTKNRCNGTLERNYSSSKVIGSLTNVLQNVPQDRYQEIAPLMKELGQDNLSPYELCQQVQKKLGGSDE